MASLGEQIRRARERKRMTQETLAALLDASVSSISNWERGKAVPKNKLGLIMEVLGMDQGSESNEGDGPSLRKASDAALLAEIARRFGRHEVPIRTGTLPEHLVNPEQTRPDESTGLGP